MSFISSNCQNIEVVEVYFTANTKHLYKIYITAAKRIWRWSNVVQILCKCFAVTGIPKDTAFREWYQYTFLKKLKVHKMSPRALKRVDLPLCEVADTPFYIQGDEE